MNHRLFVASQDVTKVVSVLVKGLGQATDIPVTKDSEAATDEVPTLTVTLGLLGEQESNEGLRRGETCRTGFSHTFLPGPWRP
jgi:hypothetical protein